MTGLPPARRLGPLHRVLYGLCWLLVRGLLRLFFRFRVHPPAEPFPDGPFVLAANHVSFLDPVVLAVSVRRRVVYLVTSDVYVFWLRPFFWFFSCIRVEEERANFQAVRRAVKELKSGRVVGIFPEGGISRDGVLTTGQPGVASLLLQADVPVVPVGISGTFEVLPRHRRWPRLHPIEVRFGPVLRPREQVAGLSGRAARRELANEVMERIRCLLPEGQRGADQRSENSSLISAE